MADPMIKEWRIVDHGRDIQISMIGEPTLELLDRVIELIIDSRNQWAEEIRGPQ